MKNFSHKDSVHRFRFSIIKKGLIFNRNFKHVTALTGEVSNIYTMPHHLRLVWVMRDRRWYADCFGF
jgi:hypothetical protein